MKVIGLTGYAGAGKDTVAQMLIDLLPDLDVKRQGFADMLKLSAARLFWPDCDMESALNFCNVVKASGRIEATAEFHWGTDAVATPCTGREFLQRYGTEAHREVFGKDFWLDAVLPMRVVGNRAHLVCDRNDCDVLVIPDVRFENEARRVRDCGGRVWEVQRPSVGAANGHASEGGVPDGLIDCEIVNDGSLDDLRLEVIAASIALAANVHSR